MREDDMQEEMGRNVFERHAENEVKGKMTKKPEEDVVQNNRLMISVD